MLEPVRRLLSVLLVALIVGAVAIAVVTQRDSDRAAPTIEELKSGVGRVETLKCDGSPLTIGGRTPSGSGFLVGSRVVMTAEHGMYVSVDPDQPACKMRVRFGDTTYPVTDVRVWGNANQRTSYDRLGVDLATLMLGEPVDGHLFKLADTGAPVGTAITTLGYPLGGRLSETRGVITKNLPDRGVPSIAARIDVQGGNSGGPILNEAGEVLSVVSRIVISGSLTDDGSNRSGGVDIPRWWGEGAYADLCRVYPDGGIPACERTGDERASKKDTVLVPSPR